jgi:hypothetical protein
MTTVEQWEYLKNYKSYVMDAARESDSDGEENKSPQEEKDRNLARPVFFALSLSNFEVARLLMITNKEIKSTLTFAELRILEALLKDSNIMTM